MRTIVIYASKTGFVEKYANWIAEELVTEAISVSETDVEGLSDYDTVIFGGGLYAGGINGSKLVKKALQRFHDKKFVMFITGASPGRDDEIERVWDSNFTKEEQSRMGRFYLRGGFDYEKLGMKDKVLMTLLRKKLESKKDRTEDEQGMLDAYDEPVDFTDKDRISELVGYVRKRA